MENNVRERIREIFNLKETNVNAVSKSLGLRQNTLNRQINGNTTIPTDTLLSIIGLFPDISTDWLLTGKGEMLKSEQRMPIINYEYKGAPYYNVDFTGGFDLVLNDQTQNPDYYIDYQPYNKPGVLWCNVTGHSMEPEINHGDTIAIKELVDWRTYLPFGEIYGIVTTEHRTIKRIGRAERKGFVLLIPTNKSPEFSPQEIPLTIIQKIFLVLGNVKRFQ